MSKLESLKKNIGSLNERLAEIKKEAQKDGKTAFREAFAELFEKFPKLQAIAWTQYTPYFNDGDPCYFGVNSWSVKVDGEKSKYGSDDYGREDFIGEWELADVELKSTLKEIFSVDEQIFEFAFGDHVEVMVTREGIEVEEYRHD